MIAKGSYQKTKPSNRGETKADLNTKSNWIFAQSILDATTEWEFLHGRAHPRLRRPLPFIYFYETGTDRQLDRWHIVQNRLERRLAKIAEANPEFNPVHFIKQKLARGRKSLNGIAIEDCPGDLEERSVQLRLRVR